MEGGWADGLRNPSRALGRMPLLVNTRIGRRMVQNHGSTLEA